MAGFDRDTCSELQKEEVFALSSIYEDDFMPLDESNKSFEIRIRCKENDWWSLTLKITVPQNYPQLDPPFYEIFGECLNSSDVERIGNELDKHWRENQGECVVYSWVEKCREILLELMNAAPDKDSFVTSGEQGTDLEGDSLLGYEAEMIDKDSKDYVHQSIREDEQSKISNANIFLPEVHDTFNQEITSGEPIIDRKSIFQAHVAYVVTEDQVRQVVCKLKENRKVGRATHNIMAYRIEGSRKDTFLQDCDDDGENEAGGRLLHLLRILDAKNIVVIVSRWYGGILLGPDRFKHINNCARKLIVDTGIFTAPNREADTGVSKKKSKAKLKKN